MEPTTSLVLLDEDIIRLVQKKTPLRGSHATGASVFYWFREDPVLEGEITSDNILLDKECQLPPALFACLPIDSIAGDFCCVYFSKMEAYIALEIAVQEYLKHRKEK